MTNLSLLSGLLLLAVFGGVVLPAVWSRRASRRAAALTVLRTLIRGRRLP